VSPIGDIGVAAATALAVGASAWLARLILRRPQQAITTALSGSPIESEVQIRVDQMSDVPALEGPTSYLLTSIDPRQVAAQDLPLGVTDWQDWAYANGGEDVTTSIVQVTLQGVSADPISIEAPNLTDHVVVARTSDERFGPGGLGGGGVLPRHYTFHLDERHIERHFVEDHGRPEAFQLAEGDTERLIIRVEAADANHHEWHIQIPYVRRGKREYLTIKHPSGSSFVTNGAVGMTHWFHDGGWFKAREVGEGS
jgi:hypothetical protein